MKRLIKKSYQTFQYETISPIDILWRLESMEYPINEGTLSLNKNNKYANDLIAKLQSYNTDLLYGACEGLKGLLTKMDVTVESDNNAHVKIEAVRELYKSEMDYICELVEYQFLCDWGKKFEEECIGEHMISIRSDSGKYVKEKEFVYAKFHSDMWEISINQL